MPRVIAYVRVSTNKQELENQRYEIERYCQARSIVVDQWDEEIVSGTVKLKDRKAGAMLEKLGSGDMLIVSEISRLSRSLRTVLNIIEDAIEAGVIITTVKENFVFGDNLNSRIIAASFGLAAQIERSLISARTKEALARKKSEGIVLGRPAGSTKPENFKLHGKDEKILRYMEKRVPITAQARLLDVNRKTLSSYIQMRKLDEELVLRRYRKMGE